MSNPVRPSDPASGSQPYTHSTTNTTDAYPSTPEAREQWSTREFAVDVERTKSAGVKRGKGQDPV